MSRTQANEQSMNGLSFVETDEIVFGDGTTMTTNNFVTSDDLTSLNTQVSTNTSDITALQGTVSTNATNISNNATNITTNATNISNNTSNITTNATNISNNTSNITTNATNISNNTSNITTNTNNIATNTTNISNNTSNITTNTNNIATNTTNIETNTNNIATNTTNIETNTSDITTLQNTVANKQDTLSTTSDVPGLDTALGNKQDTLSEKYGFYNAYFNLINQSNDSSIDVDKLPILKANGYTHFVKGIRFGFAGSPSTIVGEGRGYYMGILNKNNGSSSNAFIGFGKDGGGGGDPNIAVAISPSEGDIYYGGELRGGGRRGGRNLVIVNFNQNDAVGGSAGDDNYGGNGGDGARLGGFDGAGQRIGESTFYTLGTGTDDGIVTINTSGTYKISVNATIENAAINDRAVFGLYVSVNDANDAAAYFRNPEYAGRYGITYVRDNDFGVAGNIAFHFYVELDATNTLRVKTKLGQGSAGRAYDDTRAVADVNVFANMEVELITENDIITSA